jgi:hypothetical protein
MQFLLLPKFIEERRTSPLPLGNHARWGRSTYKASRASS